MTKSQLMKKAWQFAKGIAKKLGIGKAYEYIAEGMKRAWALFGKQLVTKKVVKKEFDQIVLKGRMTEKQESFIASLLRKKATDNPVAQAFNVSSLRSTITKQQASDLISELLAA